MKRPTPPETTGVDHFARLVAAGLPLHKAGRIIFEVWVAMDAEVPVDILIAGNAPAAQGIALRRTQWPTRIANALYDVEDIIRGGRERFEICGNCRSGGAKQCEAHPFPVWLKTNGTPIVYSDVRARFLDLP